MLEIQAITSDPYQQHTIVLDDGTLVGFTLRFVPLQETWVFDNITYGDFILNGLRCCNAPNLLYQWHNILPFGIGCFSAANREPSLQEDFQSKNSKLYILTQAEIREYAEFLENG